MSIKKLTLTVSQDCETKQGQYKVEGKKVEVSFDSSHTVGQIAGAMVDRLFDYIEYTRSRKMCPFKLSHPVQISILYNDNEWLGAKLTDTSVVNVRISNTVNKKGEQRLANELKDLLGLLMKKNVASPTLQDIADTGRMSVNDAGRVLCDMTMNKAITLN
jgi:hypothetical protein